MSNAETKRIGSQPLRSYEAETVVLRLLHLFSFALFAFAQALRDRRASGDQRGLVREALREIGVILPHNVEHGVPGQPSVVLGQESVQISELFVVHGHRASVAIPGLYRKLLILPQLLTRLVTVGEQIRPVTATAVRPGGGLPVLSLTNC